MKIHFLIGLLIGAAINLAFQMTDEAPVQINVWELCLCALLAALAALVPRASFGVRNYRARARAT